MTPVSPKAIDSSKILLRGVHVDLTDAMRAIFHEKLSRLLRHEPRIVRLRVDIEHDRTRGSEHLFVAKGHIEIGGPDLLASVASNDAYKSIDLLVGKLDRLIRRRHGLFTIRKKGSGEGLGGPVPTPHPA
jgi:putative sigma-54 modulation protein